MPVRKISMFPMDWSANQDRERFVLPRSIRKPKPDSRRNNKSSPHLSPGNVLRNDPNLSSLLLEKSPTSEQSEWRNNHCTTSKTNQWNGIQCRFHSIAGPFSSSPSFPSKREFVSLLMIVDRVWKLSILKRQIKRRLELKVRSISPILLAWRRLVHRSFPNRPKTCSSTCRSKMEERFFTVASSTIRIQSEDEIDSNREQMKKKTSWLEEREDVDREERERREAPVGWGGIDCSKCRIWRIGGGRVEGWGSSGEKGEFLSSFTDISQCWRDFDQKRTKNEKFPLIKFFLSFEEIRPLIGFIPMSKTIDRSTRFVKERRIWRIDSDGKRTRRMMKKIIGHSINLRHRKRLTLRRRSSSRCELNWLEEIFLECFLLLEFVDLSLIENEWLNCFTRVEHSCSKRLPSKSKNNTSHRSSLNDDQRTQISVGILEGCGGILLDES